MSHSRYLYGAGLAGKSSWETAVVDSITDSITDIREKAFEVAFEKDETKKVHYTVPSVSLHQFQICELGKRFMPRCLFCCLDFNLSMCFAEAAPN